MDYQEKIKLAEVYLNHLETGKTEQEISRLMVNSNVTKFDLKKIGRSASKLLSEKYGVKIKEYLLSETLEENINEFDSLSEEAFNALQIEQHENIINSSNAAVSRLLKEGKTREEIMAETINPYYNANHVDKQIEKYKYYNEPVDSKTQSKYLLIGGGAILLGILLSSSGSRIFYGLIIFGIISIFRAYQTQADIDYDRKN